MSNRLKGVTLFKPIIYGSVAEPIKIEGSDHTHKWTVMVAGYPNADISKLIKKVSFKLHDSFVNPIRKSPPFEVCETGWGEFEIIIKLYFVDPSERVFTINHFLKLYPTESASKYAGAFLEESKVIDLHYDEIVFNDPTELVHKALLNDQDVKLAGDLAAAEQREIKKLEQANKNVQKEIDKRLVELTAIETQITQIKSIL